MGLLVVVMTGVYAGLETFRRVTTLGRDAATERQLVRGLRTRLLTDLRSLRFAPPSIASDDTPANDGAAEAESSTATEDDADAEGEVVAAPEVGMIGDASSLTLFVALPARDRATGSAGRQGDLRTVSWFLDDSPDARGLCRSEGATAALSAAEAAGDTATLAAAVDPLAPEVVGLSLRYFDGAEWVDAWDSALLGALPRAIEVVIALDVDGPDPAYAAADEPGGRTPVTTRLLLCPPLSEPDAEAAL
jgi:hypothetical protein